MANYLFGEDIIEGERGEITVLNDLMKMGGVLISSNKDNKYDLLISKGGKEIKYEIKTDVYCTPDRDTGNMFIEFQSRGKDSGIMVSEAEWYVTYYKGLKEIWYIKTSDLKEMIKSESFNETKQSGDWGSNTRGYLIPRYKYKKSFIIRRTNG